MTDHTGIFKCLYIVQYSPFDDKMLTWKFIYKVLHVNNLCKKTKKKLYIFF